MSQAIRKQTKEGSLGTAAAAARPNARPSAPRKTVQQSKRVLNLPLLLATCGVGLVLAVAAFFWHGQRKDKLADTFLERAETLRQEKNWPAASTYLRHYIQVKPQDLNAHLTLIDTLEQFAGTTAQYRQIVSVRYVALGLSDNRSDLRLKLAEDLLRTNNFGQAIVELEGFADKTSNPSEIRAARKVIATSQYYLAHRERPASIEEAAAALAESLADNPGDRLVARMTAELYRTFDKELGGTNNKNKADATMDEMVAANPQDPLALFERYTYRKRHGVDGAQSDLATVLALAPDHVGALLSAAIQDRDDRNFDEAVRKAERVVSLAPKSGDGYRILADIQARQNDPAAALDILKKGRNQVPVVDRNLDRGLAELLIDANQLKEASDIKAEISADYLKRLPELPPEERLRKDNLNRLLSARLAFASGNPEESIRELEGVLIASEKGMGGVTSAKERIQALVLLANIKGKLQQPEAAAKHWSIAADEAPELLDARWKAGMSFLQAGRPNEAVQQLEKLVATENAPADAWITLIESLLQQQLRRPAADRDWKTFNDRLDGVPIGLRGRWELELAQATKSASENNDSSKRDALMRLSAVEKGQPEKAEAWLRLAMLYTRLGSSDDVQRALQEYDRREESVSRRAILRATLLASATKLNEALELLSSAVSNARPEERIELQLAKMQLLLANRQFDAARKEIDELIESAPNEPRFLLLGIELASEQQDFDVATKWTDDLEATKRANDLEIKFLRTRTKLARYVQLPEKERQGSALQLRDLKDDIDEMRVKRPTWLPLLGLAGQVAEVSNNRPAAIEAYSTAINLGEHRVEILQRLVEQLLLAGRFDEAETYMARLSAERPASDSVDSLAVQLAAGKNDVKAAITAARRAADRDSNNPVIYIWLAGLLENQQDVEGAEKALKKGVEILPKDARVWNAYFVLLAKQGRNDDARKVLDEWISHVELSSAAKHYVVGRGNERLRDLEAAQNEYRQALVADAKHMDARLRLAKLLLRSDPAAARAEFETILKTDPQNAEARRILAAQLAASGDADWQQVEKLLEGGGAGKEGGANDWLRAILLTKRGQTREERVKNCQVARGILEKRLQNEDQTTNDLDRLLLAAIYEQESLLANDPMPIELALNELYPLVSKPSPTPEYLVQYVEFALRHAKELRSRGNEQAWRELNERLLREAELRIENVQSALANHAAVEKRIIPVILRARLLALKGNDAEARKAIDDFTQKERPQAKDDPSRTSLFMLAGNAHLSVGRYAESDQPRAYAAAAEKWYRDLTSITEGGYVLVIKSLQGQSRDDEAIEIAIKGYEEKPAPERAVLILQLLAGGKASNGVAQRAMETVSKAYAANKDHVEMLMSIALLYVTKGNATKAVELYKQVVTLEPRHPMALNNLATLLAESPDREDAKKYVEQAITVMGRQPALLDTLGTILIYTGEYQQAVNTLEEAVAGPETDPRYYFHLAVAHKKLGAGHEEAAERRLTEARRLGLDSTILTAGDRNWLTSFNSNLLNALN